MQKALAPIDLLREIRRGFASEAAHRRTKESISLSKVEARAEGAKAYAAEQMVRKIDATLRDWA